MGMWELPRAPDIYEPAHDFVVDHTFTRRPDSMYGIEKVYGESLCRLAHDAHGQRCYILRIGWVLPDNSDHPYTPAERAVKEGRLDRNSEGYERLLARTKALWLSRRDAAHLVDRCLQDDTVSYDVFYGVSDNEGRWFDIDHAREMIGYNPTDNGAAWDGVPE